MRTRVKVEGLRELDAALGEMKKAMARGVLRRALLKAADPILQAAKANAPVDTGWLKDSLMAGTRLNRRLRASRVDLKGFVEVYVGPVGSARSIVQEFGSVNQAAQPYMRPAWDGNKHAALSTARAEIENEIGKTAKRLAAKAARLAAKAKAG